MLAQVENGASPGASSSTRSDMASMPGMDMSHSAPPSTVSFPYGFPSPGTYRIIVQMKHGNEIETGTFDAEINAPVEKKGSIAKFE
jgi:hypothetical protein